MSLTNEKPVAVHTYLGGNGTAGSLATAPDGAVAADTDANWGIFPS